MTTRIKAVLFPVAVMVSLAVRSAEPFERYQTIIDRKPFGPEPVNFNPEAAPGSAEAAAAAGAEMTEEQRTAEEQQLAASVRVSMINVTPSGAVAVGFTDTSVNPPENYYLVAGRSQNGWTVKSADPATEMVELEKGGVDVKVKLGETVGGGNAKGAKPRRAARPMTLQSRGGIPAHSPQSADAASVPEKPNGAPRLGGLARLRQRRAEMRAKAQEEAAKKAEADAVAAAEREERAEREAEEKRQRAEREARDAEERAQQREALRQIQEQLRKEREAREAAEQQTETVQEE